MLSEIAIVPLTRRFISERVTGIEPAPRTWPALAAGAFRENAS
jgi:hypothetical protein